MKKKELKNNIALLINENQSKQEMINQLVTRDRSQISLEKENERLRYEQKTFKNEIDKFQREYNSLSESEKLMRNNFYSMRDIHVAEGAKIEKVKAILATVAPGKPLSYKYIDEIRKILQ